MHKRIIIFLFIIALWSLGGCGNSRTPISSNTGVPIFDLDAQPSSFAPSENTMLFLVPVLPLEFDKYEGELVWFSALPDSGIFHDYPQSWIDLDAVSNLNPNVWFQYTGAGAEDTIVVTLYAHVVSQSLDTLAWDSCLISIVRE